MEDSAVLFWVFIIFVLLGTFLILHGFRLVNGKGNRSLYMTDHIYTGRVYAEIPLGIMFIVWAFSAIPKDVNTGLTVIYIGSGFLALGLIFNFTQPSFLKPTWLRWLEREHGDIMQLLIDDANEMGLTTWDERIQSQEDLEEWVEEVRRRHNLQIAA